MPRCSGRGCRSRCCWLSTAIDAETLAFARVALKSEPRPAARGRRCMSYNEMFDAGAVRPAYAALGEWVEAMPAELRQMKQAEAEALFRRIGITFAVYG